MRYAEPATASMEIGTGQSPIDEYMEGHWRGEMPPCPWQVWPRRRGQSTGAEARNAEARNAEAGDAGVGACPWRIQPCRQRRG